MNDPSIGIKILKLLFFMVIFLGAHLQSYAHFLNSNFYRKINDTFYKEENFRLSFIYILCMLNHKIISVAISLGLGIKHC